MDEIRTNAGQNGSEDALRELAARLLAPPYPSDRPSAGTEKTELFVGRPPDGMPSVVPIPDDATVVGGAVHGSSRGRRAFEIVLDVEQPAEDLREAYRQRLLAAGWRDDDRLSRRSGFVPRGLPRLFYYAASRSSRLRRRLRRRVPGFPKPLDHFLFGEHGPKLLVAGLDRQDAPADVRLILVVGQRDRLGHRDTAWTVIPSLVSPRGARGRLKSHDTVVLHPPPETRRLRSRGGRWEPDGENSLATLETSLDLAAVSAHYAIQLERAGWTKTDEGESGPQTWSTWTLRDEKGRPWVGTFTTLRLAGAPGATSGRYLLQIHAGLTQEHSGGPTGGEAE